MQPDVTPFFTIATTSSGLPSIAIRFWKEHCASGYEPSFGRSARNWEYRSSQAFCPKSMSTCSSRYHRISRSATSLAVPKGARRIAFRWSSQNFANVTGVAISGRGATSALPAATSRTRRYFSISSIMKLPASAGSYSVRRLPQYHGFGERPLCWYWRKGRDLLSPQSLDAKSGWRSRLEDEKSSLWRLSRGLLLGRA